MQSLSVLLTDASGREVGRLHLADLESIPDAAADEYTTVPFSHRLSKEMATLGDDVMERLTDEGLTTLVDRLTLQIALGRAFFETPATDNILVALPIEDEGEVPSNEAPSSPSSSETAPLLDLDRLFDLRDVTDPGNTDPLL